MNNSDGLLGPPTSLWFRFEPSEFHDEATSAHLNGAREVERAYEIWRHADELCNSSPDDLHRVDVVTTLKRCIGQRVVLLTTTYNLRRLKRVAKWKQVDDLGVLAELGLVRPLLLRNLYLIRNYIEHQDADPPPVERCREFVELVWYFLRSTDAVAATVVDDVEFVRYVRPRDDQESRDGWTWGGRLSIGYPRETWLPLVRGTVPLDQWSRSPTSGWVEVRVSHARIGDEGVRFEGEMCGGVAELLPLWRAYFALGG